MAFPFRGAVLAAVLAFGASGVATSASAAAPPSSGAAAPAASTSTAAALRTNTFGRQSQLGATLRSVRQAQAGTPGSTSIVMRQPVLNRIASYVQGAHRDDAAREIRAYVAGEEAHHGATTTLHPYDGVIGARRYGVFVAEKAVALDTYRRTPAQVSDAYVTARGSVDGRPIPTRQIFVQHWAPVQEGAIGADGKLVAHAAPTGKVFVISPGYQETGRNFYKQIDALTRQGHDVVVMDHQWAGYTEGSPGGIDSGFGVARDVAAVAAYANQLAARLYPSSPKREVVLVGNSMGAGRGVIGAMAMNDAGKIDLQGAEMPKNLSAIVEAPFLRATPSTTNRLLAAFSHVPVARDAKLVASGVPNLTHDHEAQARGADHLTMADVRTTSRAFTVTDPDMKRMLAQTKSIGGRLYVIQSEHDTLADPAATRAFVAQLGPRAHLESVPGSDHVLEESPKNFGRVLNGVAWLASPQ